MFITRQAREVEYALGARDLDGAGRLSESWLRSASSILPSAYFISTARTAQTLMYLKLSRSRASDDFLDTHARSILVDTPGADSLDSGDRHTNCGDANRGLWFVYDAAWLALGWLRLGLRSGVVLRSMTA